MKWFASQCKTDSTSASSNTADNNKKPAEPTTAAAHGGVEKWGANVPLSQSVVPPAPPKRLANRPRGGHRLYIQGIDVNTSPVSA